MQFIECPSGRRLVLSTFLGIPFDLWLLTGVSESSVKVSLALVIVAFALYNLIGGSRLKLNDDRFMILTHLALLGVGCTLLWQAASAT